MTVQQLRRIGIALVVAFGLWGLAQILRGGGDEIAQSELLRTITGEEVDTVEFAGAADTVRLVQVTPGTWLVNGYTASPDAVAELFTGLAEGATGELVARSASSHERMGVDEVGGRRLRFVRGDQTLATLMLGPQGRAYRTIYARRSGEDEVYLLEGQLATLANRPVSDWRDKRVMAVVPESVARVVVGRGPSSYTLVRGDSSWTFADGAPTDSGAVARLLGEFASLTAQGNAFATPAEADSTDFNRPDRRLTLFGMGGDTLAALVFDSTASTFWVRHLDGETLYRLYQWKVDDLTPVDSTLRKSEGEAPAV
jgi:hypothetical protein